jgi:hypothetical protein
MPTARYCAGVAVVNDTFYVVGGRSGSTGYVVIMQPDTVNEQYTPIGYEGPVQPSPSPSSSPTLSPSPSPTATPLNTQPEPFPTMLVAIASAALVAIIGIGLLVYFKKRKR